MSKALDYIRKKMQRGGNVSFKTVCLIVIFLCLPSLLFSNNVVSGDTAEYVDNPLRIFTGQIPYRDFWLLHGPGEVYFPYTIYLIVGHSVDSVLNVTIGVNIGIAVLATMVAYTLWKKKILAGVVGLLVFFNGVVYWYDVNYIHVYLIPILISIVILGQAYKEKKASLFFLASLCLGIGFFFKTYVTLSAAAGFGIVLVTSALHTSFREYTVKHIISFGCGFLVSVLVSYSYFLYTVGVGPLFKMLLLDPPQHASGLYFNHAYFVGTFDFIEKLVTRDLSFVDKMYTLFEIINSCILYLLPCLTVVVLMLIFKKRVMVDKTQEADGLMAMSILFWSLCTLPFTIAGPDMSHYAYAFTPLFLLTPFIYESVSKKIKIIVWVIVAILASSIPLHMAKELVQNYGQNYEISTEYGSIKPINRDRLNDLRKVVAYLMEERNKGQETSLLAIDGSVPYYALTGFSNPTYYDSFFDLMYRPNKDHEEEICTQIQEVPTIVVTAKSTFPPLLTVYRCLVKHFKKEIQYGEYTVWTKQ